MSLLIALSIFCHGTAAASGRELSTGKTDQSATDTPLYLAFRTNMLLDAVAVPNVGFEWAFAPLWSASATWMYAWWDNRGSNFFLRTYGGDLELRRWFGPRAAAKPLTGHHIGIYGQMLTYDIEFGHRGYLGDRWSYGAGISYGYSLPVGRHINIDFSLGVGYLGGKYREYLPIEGHYVWQATKQRRWFGPTKLEVTLVWLLGRGNVNERKGGSR